MGQHAVCVYSESLNLLTHFNESYVLVLPLLILVVNRRADAQTCESGAELAPVLGSEINKGKAVPLQA